MFIRANLEELDEIWLILLILKTPMSLHSNIASN